MDDLHQATGRDLNLVVGQKHNATVGGDMQDRRAAQERGEGWSAVAGSPKLDRVGERKPISGGV